MYLNIFTLYKIFGFNNPLTLLKLDRTEPKVLSK